MPPSPLPIPSGSPPPQSFAELERRHRRGVDFDVVVQRRPGSRIAVVAPHGGAIERATSAIARALAGDEHNLYLFEGRLDAHNHERLHLTSHRFDEPECLALLAHCDHVLTVHGCNHPEPDPAVLLGGLDTPLVQRMAAALHAAGLPALSSGHAFPGRHPHNICNRGRRGAGVQLELTNRLRGGPLEAVFVGAVRALLGELAAGA